VADATIVLAGGTGTRLWPASTRSHPKQLLRIGQGPSLVQRAVKLAAGATTDGPIVIVTNVDQVVGIDAHVGELANYSSLSERVVFVPEPFGRNTAPAIALGMSYLKSRLPGDATVLVLSADHVIEPAEIFASDAETAAKVAQTGRLVCFGIQPSRPETGYGYIEAGAAFEGGFQVKQFTEKPDRETASRYLADGGYYWNAGLFCFTVDGFFAELAKCAPEIHRQFAASSVHADSATDSGSRTAEADSLIELYTALPKISIDYALMEKSDSVAVVPAQFSWSDVGSWDELAKIATEADDLQAVIEVEAGANFVESDLPVAICGVSDIHVIVKNGRVLVCRRGKSQLVRQAVEAAEAAGRDDLL